MGWGWVYDGVNASIPRNTGPECAEYLTLHRKLIESVIVVTICFCSLKWAISNARPIVVPKAPVYSTITTGKQILLIGMTLTLGMELGFKLSSRTVIYILNPCHITSMIQIYLLAAKPSKTTTVLFRIHLNYLNGPLLAYVFPEIESRTIALEAATYYIQHGLLFIIPIYLLKYGGPYNVEAIGDLSWNIMAYALLMIYHFSVLEICAIPFQVNLNHMLCPALLDPFEGQNYRIWAICHELILCTFLCKLYCIAFRPSANNVNFDVKIINNENESFQQKIQLPNTLLSSSDNIGCDANQGKKTANILEKNIKKIE